MLRTSAVAEISIEDFQFYLRNAQQHLSYYIAFVPAAVWSEKYLHLSKEKKSQPNAPKAKTQIEEKTHPSHSNHSAHANWNKKANMPVAPTLKEKNEIERNYHSEAPEDQRRP